METSCEYLDYESTGYFSGLVLDYIRQKETLRSFYTHQPNIEGIKATIAARQAFETPRQLLVDELRKQYAGIDLTPLQNQHLNLLLQSNTFTITTAHQPNIFTGHLYFIYKILHVIRLADQLTTELPRFSFVPVFYMGSEDADLDELGHIELNGERLTWQTQQTGAVGRMKVDKALIALIDRITAELDVQPCGEELSRLLRSAYKEGATIQHATLLLVHGLFKDYGLLVLIPDNAALKAAFNPVVARELKEQFSHRLVAQTAGELRQHYKVQASGREVNLFYLVGDRRERIEKSGDDFTVPALSLTFTHAGMLQELEQHPERFSANVILRGVFQEVILPNIAFVGGGGEIAYWMELRRVFDACHVPFPMLIVRNSFMLVTDRQFAAAEKLGFTIHDLFKPEQELVNQIVRRESDRQLSLTQECTALEQWFSNVQTIAGNIDPTLAQHTAGLKTQALKKIGALEKKMLRAEKRRFDAQQRKIRSLKNALFPKGNLQERTDNFSPYYAAWGRQWLEALYQHSLGLGQRFAVLTTLSSSDRQTS